jgi:hypothetical protein
VDPVNPDPDSDPQHCLKEEEKMFINLLVYRGLEV